MVLRKDLASPVAPESDEEGAAVDAAKPGSAPGSAPDAALPTRPSPARIADKDDQDKDKDDDKSDAETKTPAKGEPATRPPRSPRATPPKPVRIDFDGLDQRIVAVPIDHA